NPDRILASRARFLIVHLDLPREEDRIEPPEGRPQRSLPRVLQVELRRRAHRLTERLEELWGPPDGSSGGLLLWDLDRVRGGHRHPADSAEAVGLATSG
ncbi:MAG TPA: hypothetical protein VN783_09330, partial [Thermoanaerobaculia bacterium]|nr:hypothetical protein [Thermoanaerobaculia bacterium]